MKIEMEESPATASSTSVTDVTAKAQSWRAEVIPKAEALAKSAEALTIVGCLDGEKAGFDACHTKYGELVKARTGTEKFAKELKEEAQRVVTAVDATKREILAVTATQEARLKSLLDEYKQRKEKARKEALARRVSALQAVAAKFDLGDLEEMSEKDFEELHAEAKAAFLETQAREAEEAQRKDLVKKRIDVLRQKQGLDLYTGDLDDLWQVDEFAFSKLLTSADERAALRIQQEQEARDRATLTAGRQSQLGNAGLVLAVEKGISITELGDLTEEQFAALMGEARARADEQARRAALDETRKRILLDAGIRYQGDLGGLEEEAWLDLFASENSKKVLADEMAAHQKALDILTTYNAIPFIPAEWLSAPELARRTPDELNNAVRLALEDAQRKKAEQEAAQAREAEAAEEARKAAQSSGKQIATAYLQDFLGKLAPVPSFPDPNDDYLVVVLDNFLRAVSDEANSIIDDLKNEAA